MPYHAEFLEARDSQGRRYRKDNGDQSEYCMHSFVIYPKFGNSEEYHANFIPLSKKVFEGFTGVCQECGQVIYINAEDVVENEEAQEKILTEALKDVLTRKPKITKG